ncbi:hypothetical protein RHMOL_Rhmol13G0276500 [Rhododendron molle]|uniref:Uncharacterized protein n=1 Tax=Rhododendron molle TaxID=49168 RepID=A0ACC0LBK6_RHOML|nr:hypothetical protein RHMOL_Rhmol13G0276500 [Rhododendron molle]
MIRRQQRGLGVSTAFGAVWPVIGDPAQDSYFDFHVRRLSGQRRLAGDVSPFLRSRSSRCLHRRLRVVPLGWRWPAWFVDSIHVGRVYLSCLFLLLFPSALDSLATIGCLYQAGAVSG